MPHTAVLKWTASTDAVTGYNVRKGSVSGGEKTLLTATPITVLTYTDSAADTADSWYEVTSVLNGVESLPVEAEAVFLPFGPTGLTISTT